MPKGKPPKRCQAGEHLWNEQEPGPILAWVLSIARAREFWGMKAEGKEGLRYGVSRLDLSWQRWDNMSSLLGGHRAHLVQEMCLCRFRSSSCLD